MWLLVCAATNEKRYRVFTEWHREHGHPRSTWGFLTVTQVCSHWRQLAISDPRLWSFIDLTDEHSTPLCLERSRSFPLEVFGPFSYNQELSGKALTTFCTSAAVRRLEKLVMCVPFEDMSTLTALLTTTEVMPNLKALDLEISGEFYPSTLHIQIGSYKAPLLYILTLADVHPVLSPDAFNGLQFLDLTFHSLYYELDVDDLLTSFGPFSRLMILKIRGVVVKQTPIRALPGIKLSALQILKLDLPRESVYELLLRLTPYIGTFDTRFSMTIRTASDTILGIIPPDFFPAFEIFQGVQATLKIIVRPNDAHITVDYAISGSGLELQILDMPEGGLDILYQISEMYGPLLVTAINLLFHYRNAEGSVDVEHAFRDLFFAFPKVELLRLPPGPCALYALHPCRGCKDLAPFPDIEPLFLFPGPSELDPLQPNVKLGAHTFDPASCVALRSLAHLIVYMVDPEAMEDILACVRNRWLRSVRLEELCIIFSMNTVDEDDEDRKIYAHMRVLEAIVPKVERWLISEKDEELYWPVMQSYL